MVVPRGSCAGVFSRCGEGECRSGCCHGPASGECQSSHRLTNMEQILGMFEIQLGELHLEDFELFWSRIEIFEVLTSPVSCLWL